MRIASLLGACQRKGVSFAPDSCPSSGLGGINSLLPSRYVVGAEKLMPKSLVCHSCWVAISEYLRCSSEYLTSVSESVKSDLVTEEGKMELTVKELRGDLSVRRKNQDMRVRWFRRPEGLQEPDRALLFTQFLPRDTVTQREQPWLLGSSGNLWGPLIPAQEVAQVSIYSRWKFNGQVRRRHPSQISPSQGPQ